MVQNIRPPQGPDFPQRQSENAAKPPRGIDSTVEARLRTPAPAPTKEQVEQAAARVKDVFRGTTSHVKIEIDPDLHKVVIKVLSGESGEIIRQIPSQELLDLAKQLSEPKGLLVRERA
ncbi:MAG: flagellar protein FlaG [Nitrospirota bacterium]